MNHRQVFSTFLECSQMSSVFNCSEIHGVGFFINVVKNNNSLFLCFKTWVFEFVAGLIMFIHIIMIIRNTFIGLQTVHERAQKTFVSCAYIVCWYLFFTACGVATSSLQKDGYSLLHCEVQSQVSRFLVCFLSFHYLCKIVIFGASSTFTQPNSLICQMSI
mgnify:FL=1